jgi:hypothetical protein
MAGAGSEEEPSNEEEDVVPAEGVGGRKREREREGEREREWEREREREEASEAYPVDELLQWRSVRSQLQVTVERRGPEHRATGARGSTLVL